MKAERASEFDVIVVGARCAGSPLAALLAQRGLSVAVLEKATFPHDTLSTHVFEADALSFLGELGLTEQLLATGAPPIKRADNRIEDRRWSGPWPTQPGEVGGAMSVRRFVLDPFLAEAARVAGAEVQMATKVTELVVRNDRVVGVRVESRDSLHELRARLVVGADGRSSTVARLVGARRYNTVPNQRALFWSFFEGAEIGEPTFVFHRWGKHMVQACPTDSGLYQVGVFVDLADLDYFRAELDAHFLNRAFSCQPVARAIAQAEVVDKLRGISRWEGFFREASGPGWVLTGDAGHFKDPAPGRGIGDAFLQAERLASLIAPALKGPDEAIDAATARWGRWRDKEFAEHYWFANDLGSVEPLPAVLPEVLGLLESEGKASLVLEINNHRLKPSQLLTPGRLLRATARALGGKHRRQILAQVPALLGRELRRRRLQRRPRYAQTDPAGLGSADGEDLAEGMLPEPIKGGPR
jgi:flavin-dependent dehydrogenase